MKNLRYKSVLILKVWMLILPLTFWFGACNANTNNSVTDTVEVVPDWYTNVPQKPGFVYGAGLGKSSDLATAMQKAGLMASTSLAKSYPDRFTTFEKRCDSVLDVQTQKETLVTIIKTTTEAQLTNIEITANKVFYVKGTYIVYELKRVSTAETIGAMKKAINENPKLKKSMKSKGLLAELDKL